MSADLDGGDASTRSLGRVNHLDDTGSGQADVVIALWTSWRAAAARDFSYSEDRLLLRGWIIRESGARFVCDPFRNRVAKVVRDAQGHRGIPFPSSPSFGQYAPPLACAGGIQSAHRQSSAATERTRADCAGLRPSMDS